MATHALNEKVKFNLLPEFLFIEEYDGDGEKTTQICSEPYLDDDGETQYKYSCLVWIEEGEKEEIDQFYDKTEDRVLAFKRLTGSPEITLVGNTAQEPDGNFFTNYMAKEGMISVVAGASVRVSDTENFFVGTRYVKGDEEPYEFLLSVLKTVLINDQKLPVDGLTSDEIKNVADKALERFIAECDEAFGSSLTKIAEEAMEKTLKQMKEEYPELSDAKTEKNTASSEIEPVHLTFNAVTDYIAGEYRTGEGPLRLMFRNFSFLLPAGMKFSFDAGIIGSSLEGKETQFLAVKEESNASLRKRHKASLEFCIEEFTWSLQFADSVGFEHLDYTVMDNDAFKVVSKAPNSRTSSYEFAVIGKTIPERRLAGELYVKGSLEEKQKAFDTILGSFKMLNAIEKSTVYNGEAVKNHLLTYNKKKYFKVIPGLELPIPDGYTKVDLEQHPIFDTFILPESEKTTARKGTISLTEVPFSAAVFVMSDKISHGPEDDNWIKTVLMSNDESAYYFGPAFLPNMNEYVHDRSVYVDTVTAMDPAHTLSAVGLHILTKHGLVVVRLISGAIEPLKLPENHVDIKAVQHEWINNIKVDGRMIGDIIGKNGYTGKSAGAKTLKLKTASPSESQYPHYQALQDDETESTIGGIRMIRNSGGTSFEAREISDFAEPADESAISAAYKSMPEYTLDRTAREFATVFRVPESDFDPRHDRENEINAGQIQRAYQRHALRSFAWTLSEYCKASGIDIADADMDTLIAIGDHIKNRRYLNYSPKGGKYNFPQDIHVFFIPDSVKAAVKKNLVADQGGQVGPAVGSLNKLRYNLEELLPVMGKIFDHFAENKDAAKPDGPLADVLYAWCAFAVAAGEPFFSEDGPMTNYFTRLSTAMPEPGSFTRKLKEEIAQEAESLAAGDIDDDRVKMYVILTGEKKAGKLRRSQRDFYELYQGVFPSLAKKDILDLRKEITEELKNTAACERYAKVFKKKPFEERFKIATGTLFSVSDIRDPRKRGDWAIEKTKEWYAKSEYDKVGSSMDEELILLRKSMDDQLGRIDKAWTQYSTAKKDLRVVLKEWNYEELKKNSDFCNRAGENSKEGYAYIMLLPKDPAKTPVTVNGSFPWYWGTTVLDIWETAYEKGVVDEFESSVPAAERAKYALEHIRTLNYSEYLDRKRESLKKSAKAFESSGLKEVSGLKDKDLSEVRASIDKQFEKIDKNWIPFKDAKYYLGVFLTDKDGTAIPEAASDFQIDDDECRVIVKLETGVYSDNTISSPVLNIYPWYWGVTIRDIWEAAYQIYLVDERTAGVKDQSWVAEKALFKVRSNHPELKWFKDSELEPLKYFTPYETPLRPEVSKGQQAAGKEGCYIATAVYGSYDAPQVTTLRRFRDDTLKASALGRWFIRSYYRLSPPVARKLKDAKHINAIVRRILDKWVEKLER